jgi:hypothetical protein
MPRARKTGTGRVPGSLDACVLACQHCRIRCTGCNSLHGTIGTGMTWRTSSVQFHRKDRQKWSLGECWKLLSPFGSDTVDGCAKKSNIRSCTAPLLGAVHPRLRIFLHSPLKSLTSRVDVRSNVCFMVSGYRRNCNLPLCLPDPNRPQAAIGRLFG